MSLYKRSFCTYLDAFNHFFFFLALEISNCFSLNSFLNVQNEAERFYEHLQRGYILFVTVSCKKL